MELPATEVSYIIDLHIVISVLPISSILIPYGYHVRFKQKTVNKEKWSESNMADLLEPNEPNPFSFRRHSHCHFQSNSNPIPVTISECTNYNPDVIPGSNCDHSHCSTLLQAVRLQQWLCEAVSKHLRSRYVVQVYLSISSHMWSKRVFGRNVCNCSSAVYSVLDRRDQWQRIEEHLRDSRDAELVQKMWALCKCHAAYCEGIVFGIVHSLRSWLLYSWSPVDRSSEGVDQSTCRFIVIWACSIV